MTNPDAPCFCGNVAVPDGTCPQHGNVYDDRNAFWDYCQENLKEVLSWPEWMRGGQ